MPTNPIKKMMSDAAALDNRRQQQIRNQIESINRLMSGGTYDDEMARLHMMLAGAQHHIELQRDLLLENKVPMPMGDRCGICGHREDHWGVPHSVATGDGMTRADATATADQPPA